MVVNNATMKRDGVQDFVSLRATAVIMAAYVFFMAAFFFTTPELTFEGWRALFGQLWVKVFTLMALVSMMVHVRIGLWQVLTDYVKCSRLRGVLGFILNLMAFAYVAYGLFVLWGV